MAAIAIRGPPTSELAASGRSIVVQRPRTTLKKTFTFEHVVSTDASTASELYETAVAPALDEAFPSVGCCVIAMGSEQTGKSRTVRGDLFDEGVAVRAVRDAFAAARAPEGGELLVTLSAVLDAIVQGAGETPLQGKQPVRERLLDALQPTAGQPAAGLNVRENADALPHARRFFVEGLSERIAHSVDEAEALVREAFTRCAEEEASRRALRVHLLLILTLRRRAPDGSEHVSELSVLDVAGVPRPRSSADAPSGAGAGAASRGRGGAAGAGRGRAGGSAGRAGGSTSGGAGAGGSVGEDPFVKALYRIVDVLQEAKVAHVPYRDSKFTRLIAEALGGPAHLLPLLHMRSDRFDEAEAVLLLGQKLQRLCAPAGVAGGALRLPRGLGGVKPPSGPPLCTVREDGWWNPLAEKASAEALAAELCEQLGVRREGLVSSSIALDADSTDELLHLQEALLLSERLEARCASWGGGVLRLPPPPAFVPPPRVPMAATAPAAPPLAPSSPAAARALPPPPAVQLPWLDSAAAEEVEEEEAEAGAEASAPESPAETVAEPPFTAAFTAVGETEARPRPTKTAAGEAEILAEILGGSFGCRPPSSHRLPAAPTCPAATTAAAARSGVRALGSGHAVALDSGHSVAAAPDGALRENPAGASTPPVDHSKLALVKRSSKPRPFVPTPGGRVLAQYDNGEWYAAKVRATSRAADGAQLYVVAFDEDGLVQHLPAQRLRAPRTATPQAPRTASRHS